MAEEISSTSDPGNVPPPLPSRPSSMAGPRRQRLPGTYAGNYLQDDPNPASAAVILGALFAVAFVCEVARLFAEIFLGYSLETDAFALVRVALASLSLLLLWVGLDWARWPLAAGAFVFGAGLILRTMSQGTLGLVQQPDELVSIPLGFLYLGIALYAGFSSNVTALAGRQREVGKRFSVAPVICLGGLALLGLLGLRPLCLAWQAREQQQALAFADESVLAIGEHWDYRVFDERAAADYIAQWPVEAKKAVFHDMTRWGPIRRIDQHSIRVLRSLELGKGIRWHGYYDSRDTTEHGLGSMSLEMERGLFSPWRITAWTLRPQQGTQPPR